MTSSPLRAATEPPQLLIEAGCRESNYWRDIWRYRDLFLFLAWRDVAVRYKQTIVGILWALIQPGLTLVIFTFFGRVARIETHGVPRAVLVFAALLPWQFFSNALTAAGTSLVSNSSLVTKVYFPRLIIPCSSVMTSLVDFGLAMLLYLGLATAYHAMPDWRLVALPLFVLLAIVTALGTGLWITALNVKYRDFRFVLPFITQLGLYISPVAFPTDLVPAHWQWLYRLNPMVGVIDGFRWSMLRAAVPIDSLGLAISCAAAVLVLGTGVAFFRTTERRFADFI